MVFGGRDMELTKNQIKMTKGIAILFMLLLHLFCTKEYEGLYTPLIFIGDISFSILFGFVWRLLCSYILFLQWLWINN